MVTILDDREGIQAGKLLSFLGAKKNLFSLISDLSRN
jgi:hypothetical protein